MQSAGQLHRSPCHGVAYMHQSKVAESAHLVTKPNTLCTNQPVSNQGRAGELF